MQQRCRIRHRRVACFACFVRVVVHHPRCSLCVVLVQYVLAETSLFVLTLAPASLMLLRMLNEVTHHAIEIGTFVPRYDLRGQWRGWRRSYLLPRLSSRVLSRVWLWHRRHADLPRTSRRDSCCRMPLRRLGFLPPTCTGKVTTHTPAVALWLCGPLTSVVCDCGRGIRQVPAGRGWI